MATVTEPRQSYQPSDTDRRVQHPLQALRGYIRTYVVIEGIMISVIFVALWFWIGLALDFGSFKSFPIFYDEAAKAYQFGGFDWIQTLQWLSPPGQDTSSIVRIVLLCVLVVSLLALVAFKVFVRLFVEFRDTSLALVLERRFPKQLGDRLITAVELADPRLSDRYGMSRAMIEKTIKEAAERVEELPVSQVFNWSRLRLLTLLAFGLTIGLYLLLWGVFVGVAAAIGAADAPGDFFWRFNHVAGVWAERNLLVENSYWPRQAHLEIVRFQDTESHPDEMRVGRDDQRPDVVVRGVRWVFADRASPDGWRSLRWSDLPTLGDEELTKRMQAVDIPADWPAWIIDIGDLDSRVPIGVLDSSWNNKTRGEVAAAINKPEFKNKLAGLGKRKEQVEKAIADLLNWKTWTVDKIDLQEEKGEVRRAMRDNQPRAHAALNKVFERLAELADAVPMERTLRQLDVPERVEVEFRGKKTKLREPYVRGADSKFTVGLGGLQESVEFVVRGADFYTRPRTITLVPPPSIISLKVDKEEPAYIYYRVADLAELKGKKQQFKNISISISGDRSDIQAPLGTTMTLTAEADRKLKDGILINRSDKAKPSALVPLSQVKLHSDHKTFSMQIPKLETLAEYDFTLEFIDEDNVKGKRRVNIKPVEDKAPTLELDMTVVLRKPSQQKGARSADEDGFLVTPDALIPFKGVIRDDYGLTDAHWQFKVREVNVELGGKNLSRHNESVSRVVSGMQYTPAHTGLLGTSVYWTWVTAHLLADKATAPQERELTAVMAEFRDRLRGVREVPLNALEQYLKSAPKRSELLREHNIQTEAGFDFATFLSGIKVNDASKDAQKHYVVKVLASAADNNVETGPGVSTSPKATTFLVVSENELLTQIFQEEETLREQLEKVIQQLEDGRTVLDEQITKLSTPAPQLSLVSFRISEVQKTASNTASRTREIHRDYSRILTELKVNRVKQAKVDSVENEIVRPLFVIVDQNPEPKDVQRVGNFTSTEDALSTAYQGVESDAVSLAKAEEDKTVTSTLLNQFEQNRATHLQAGQLGRDRMNRLIADLKTVLDNMEEGINEARITAILVTIERDQRETAERLNRFHDAEVQRILDELLNPKN